MRYKLLTDIGGFLWWLVVKFCSTKLEDEQVKEKWSRNIIVFILATYLVGFLIVQFF